MARTDGSSGGANAPISGVVLGALGELDRQELADRMTGVMLAEIPDLRGDAAIERALAASVAGNVETVLHAMLLGIDPGTIEAPLAAMEYPRLLAQRGLPLTALVRAYRLGQGVMLGAMHEVVRGTALDAEGKLAAAEWITQWSFSYSDTVIETVITAYQRERDRWMQGRSSARVARARELLAGTDVPDVDEASISIGYPLRRRHLALIASLPSVRDGDDLVDRLEAHVRELAAAVGPVEAPLFIAADQRTVWGWLPVADPGPAIERARAHVTASSDGALVVFGTVRPGLDGFRRSHREAAAVRRTVVDDGAGGGAWFAGDPGVMVAALVGAERAGAQAWARDVLGDLATESESDARLRETLAVFLRHGGSYKAAAEELNMHANSVKYRVQRAVARRGREIADDRLDVEVALLVFRPARTGRIRRSLS